MDEFYYRSFLDSFNLDRPISLVEMRELFAFVDTHYDGKSGLSRAFDRFLSLGALRRLDDDDKITLLQDERINLFRFSIIDSICDEIKRVRYIGCHKYTDERQKLLERLQSKEAVLEYLRRYAIPGDREKVYREKLTEEERMAFIENELAKGNTLVIKDVVFLDDVLNQRKLLDSVDFTREEFSLHFDDVMNGIDDSGLFFDMFLKYEDLASKKLIKHIYEDFTDDDILKNLDRCTTKAGRRILIASLNDDDLKRAFLDEFKKEKHLLMLATRVEDVDLKIDIIKRFSSNSYKVSVALTAKEDDDLMKMYELFKGYYYGRLEVAKALRDENLKLALIKSGSFDEYGMISILATIKNRDIQKEAAPYCAEIEDKETMTRSCVREYENLDAKEDALPEELHFGVEIEARGHNAIPIVASTDFLIERYDVEKEREGAEFKSDILSWCESDLNTIAHVCDFALQNDLESNEYCGGHIHYSANFLITWLAWFWFFYIYTKTERIFYLISNEAGTEIREEIMTYAKPISKLYADLFKSIMKTKTPREFIEMIQENTGHKTEGVNLQNIFNRFDTIEFRIPNGSLNYRVIEENILLFGNLLKLARSLSMLPIKGELYDLIMALDRENYEDEKLEILLKLLFKNEENRQIFRERYYQNFEIYDSPYSEVDLEEYLDEVNLSDEKICI